MVVAEDLDISISHDEIMIKEYTNFGDHYNWRTLVSVRSMKGVDNIEMIKVIYEALIKNVDKFTF